MTGPVDDQERALRRRLSALRADLPDGDFQASLRRRLVAAGPPADPSAWRRLAAWVRARRVLAPASGLALGAAAGLAVFLLLASRGPGTPALATRLPTTQVAVVRLTLSADGPVEAARIRVSLPPGLSFWAEGAELAQRDFEWTQALSAGDNEIPIAVRGRRPGRYRIGVDARFGGQRVEDEIVIEVTGG